MAEVWISSDEEIWDDSYIEDDFIWLPSSNIKGMGMWVAHKSNFRYVANKETFQFVATKQTFQFTANRSN